MEQRLQELKEKIKQAKQINREIKQVKRKEKALDKLTNLVRKYDWELTREDNKLIIRGLI